MTNAPLIPLRARDGSIRAYAIVDPGDFERFGHLRWHLDRKGYARRYAPNPGGNGRPTLYLHREILGLVPGDERQGDHIRGNRLDNRRSNLRITTRAENQQNRTGLDGRNTSGYRGVTWVERHKKWQAQAKVNGRYHYLGAFEDIEEAARVVSEFRAQHMPSSRDARMAA